MDRREFGALLESLRRIAMNIEMAQQEHRRFHEDLRQGFRELRQEVKDGHESQKQDFKDLRQEVEDGHAMLDAKIELKFDKLDEKVELRADKTDEKIAKLDERVELKFDKLDDKVERRADKLDAKIGKLDDTSTSAILVIVRWGFGSAVVIILALIGMLWTAIGGPAAF